MQQLAGKLALVTGGGRGIGAGVRARARRRRRDRSSCAAARKRDLERSRREIGGVALKCRPARPRLDRRMLAELPADRHPGQQRRHRRERVAREDDRRAVGPHHGARRDGAVSPDARARAGDGEGGLGPRRQHRVERRRVGLRLHRGVLRGEARDGRLHARARDRSRAHRRDDQRAVPRLGRDRRWRDEAVARIAAKTGARRGRGARRRSRR